MEMTVLKQFFIKSINKLCIQEIQEFEKKVDQQFFENIYNRLVVNIGQDFVRILLPEYNLFKEKCSEENKSMSNFCKYICTEEFICYLYNKYTLLEEKLTRKICDTLAYVKEIGSYYDKEKEQLSHVFNSDFNNIVDIFLGEGDLHDGKTACKVITDTKTLYYKPVSGNSATIFYKIIDFLLKGNPIKDRRVKYYTKDNHMWMEEVQHKACDSVEEIKEYYYLSGIYLFAFYILNSFDMHHENIVSHVSTPVVVDFETLTLLSTNNLEAEDYKESVNSVINTLFLPFINDSGAYDVNISGILSDTCKSQKEYYEYSFSEKKGIVVEKKTVEIIIENQVSLKGEKVIGKYIELEEIRLLLREGFLEAGKNVLGDKKGFIDLVDNYLEKNFVEFRQLLRPTEVYAHFIFATNHPDYLISQKNTNKILMILQDNFNPSSFGYLRVEAEVENIKKGYVPKFYALYNSTNLYSNGRVICKDYFCETVKEKIEGKVNLLDQNIINYQMHLIDLSFLILHKQKDFGHSIVRHNSPKKINSLYVKERSIELLNYFKEIEIRYRKHEISTFLAPHLSNKDDMWRIREIDSNLYEYGGIVLFSAYYGKIFKDTEAINFSTRLLNYFNNVPGKKRLSVFSGNGSLLYLNIQMYNLLKSIKGYDKKARIYKESYIHYANQIMDEILMNNLIESDFDFIHGAYTSVYLICKMCAMYGETSGWMDKLKKIKDIIVKEFDESMINDIGYAHGITGCVVIMSAIYRLFPEYDLKEIISKLILKENIMIDNIGIDNLPSTWCRGTSGILLGRELIRENMSFEREMGTLNKNILKFQKELISDKSIKSMLSINNLCVCHGIYGNIEILKKIGKHKKYAKYFYNSMFDSFKDINWLNNKIDVPIHSFMLGNLGIAYVLLELVSDDIPTFLTLDIL